MEISIRKQTQFQNIQPKSNNRTAQSTCYPRDLCFTNEPRTITAFAAQQTLCAKSVVTFTEADIEYHVQATAFYDAFCERRHRRDLGGVCAWGGIYQLDTSYDTNTHTHTFGAAAKQTRSLAPPRSTSAPPRSLASPSDLRSLPCTALRSFMV